MTQRSSTHISQQVMPRLSAPITKLRKQWLSLVKDLDLQAALAVLRDKLKGETVEAVRLGNIAAQSWIIRQRLTALQAALHGQPVAALRDDSPNPAEMIDTATSQSVTQSEAEKAAILATKPAHSWIKLRILQETEVNGVRFFAGTTIQVHEDDAQKLIAANSAEHVTEAAEVSPQRRPRSTKKTQTE